MLDSPRQKKVAVINDFSGFGRCSLTVSLPILSVMQLQCCPIPTAIFSNHTGYDSFQWTDYTAQMPGYMAEWEKLHLSFDAIATGFLGSAAQIDIVQSFFTHFKQPHTLVLVDPVMGDYGTLYSTYTDELANRMKHLLPYADILTPNLTEACILTDTPYQPSFTEAELTEICAQLAKHGPQKIVISGIHLGEDIGNFVYEIGKTPTLLKTLKIGTNRSGTGDVFASILIADAVAQVDFLTSVQKACSFISRCIERSIEFEIPITDGICFEEYLYTLSPALQKENYHD